MRYLKKLQCGVKLRKLDEAQLVCLRHLSTFGVSIRIEPHFNGLSLTHLTNLFLSTDIITVLFVFWIKMNPIISPQYKIFSSYDLLLLKKRREKWYEKKLCFGQSAINLKCLDRHLEKG